MCGTGEQRRIWVWVCSVAGSVPERSGSGGGWACGVVRECGDGPGHGDELYTGVERELGPTMSAKPLTRRKGFGDGKENAMHVPHLIDVRRKGESQRLFGYRFARFKTRRPERQVCFHFVLVLTRMSCCQFSCRKRCGIERICSF